MLLTPVLRADGHHYRDYKKGDSKVAGKHGQLLFAPCLTLKRGCGCRADLSREAVVLAVLHCYHDNQTNGNEELESTKDDIECVHDTVGHGRSGASLRAALLVLNTHLLF